MNTKIMELSRELEMRVLTQPPTNLMQVVREHYDYWNEVLFPVLVSRKIPTYKTVAGILIDCGYANANPSIIKDYFGKIRNERKCHE
jgi:hypothetical protein